jgi:hypothetical protein
MYYNDNGKYPPSGGATNGPNNGWSNSSDASWLGTSTFPTAMRPYMNYLPADPKNTDGWSVNATNIYNYSYVTCPTSGGRAYMLVYRLENDTSVVGTTVNFCGTSYKYGNGSITTGVDSPN